MSHDLTQIVCYSFSSPQIILLLILFQIFPVSLRLIPLFKTLKLPFITVPGSHVEHRRYILSTMPLPRTSYTNMYLDLREHFVVHVKSKVENSSRRAGYGDRQQQPVSTSNTSQNHLERLTCLHCRPRPIPAHPSLTRSVPLPKSDALKVFPFHDPPNIRESPLIEPITLVSTQAR